MQTPTRFFSHFICALILTFAATLVAILAPAGHAAPGDAFEPLRSVLSRHKQNPKHYGIWVQRASGPLIAHQSDRQMVPASLSKLITAAAVLEKVPLDTQFSTTLWRAGEIENGELKGDLILKGGGDPGFVSESMWVLVNEFRRLGVQKISGTLIADDSWFDQNYFSKTRDGGRVDRAYDAPVSALSFNWNSVTVYVRPGKAGAPAAVFIDPQNEYVTLKNNAKTVSGRGNKIVISRTTSSRGDTVVVSGSIGASHPELVVYKNISNPSLWAVSNLKEFLKQRGIEVAGEPRVGTAPGDAVKVAEVKSKPVAAIVGDMQKFSNNFVAEMLIKNIAALQHGPPGTMVRGIGIAEKYLDEIGLPKGSYTFRNPAGLTHDNKFSPLQLGRLLEELRKRFSVAPEFMAALPIAGFDGTLKNRMADIRGRVRAKTGLLDGVAGLGGYGLDGSGQMFSFVFIYNGPDNFIAVRRVFDEMASTLTRLKDNP